MNREPLTALTTLLLAAFVIDRVASAVTFLFSRPSLQRQEPEAAARSEWNRKLLYFFLSCALAGASLVVLGKAQLLARLGVILDAPLDMVVTLILLVGGADRISAIFKAPVGAPGKEAAPEPIEVRGTLRIDDSQPRPAGR